MKEPKKKKSNAGRKKVVIDWKRVDKSLMSGSNGVQVSAMLGVHPDTLYNKCKEVKKMEDIGVSFIVSPNTNEDVIAAPLLKSMSDFGKRAPVSASLFVRDKSPRRSESFGSFPVAFIRCRSF